MLEVVLSDEATMIGSANHARPRPVKRFVEIDGQAGGIRS